MSELQKFSKGYLEKFHEPRLISGYSGKVCTDACFMMLEEIPSEDYRVTIKGYNEVLNLDDIENENDFYVDYTNNYIYFHKSKMGQTITVDDYYGIGLNFIGASRIIVRSNVSEDVIQTLEDLIEQAKLCLEAITTLGGAVEVIDALREDTETGRKVDKQLKETIKNGNATVQAIKDTGNKSFIVNKTDWTSTTNGYKYTLTHNLQSIDLHVSMIDLTDNMAYPSQYKIINVNTIEVYAMEKIKANIVISARYYNGLGDNVGDNIVQEVADARGGMTSLGDKIRDMDKQLVTEIDNVNSSLEDKVNKDRYNDLVINVKYFGAVGNSEYYDWESGIFYADSNKTIIANNDTECINKAIEYCKSINGKLFFPKGNYQYDDTLIIDGFVVEGNNAVIESKNKNGIIIKTGDDRRYVLNNITISGRSQVESIGISFSMETHNSTNRVLNNVSVFNFETDVQFNDNSYLIKFYNCKLSLCKYAIYFPNGLKNSGENISFEYCTLTSTEAVVKHYGFGHLKFINCSFDYFSNRAFDMRGRATCELIGCHIECYTDKPNEIIKLIEDGTTFKMLGGTIILNKNNKNVTIPNLIYCNDVKHNSGVFLTNVTLDDIILSTNFLADGDGNVVLQNCSHYLYSETFKMISKNNRFNLMSDGDFSSKIDDTNLTKDLVFLRNCTNKLNWRNGSSITITTEPTTSGLTLTKYGKVGAESSIAVAVPIGNSSRHNCLLTLNNNSFTVGSIDLTLNYVKLIDIGDNNPIIKHRKEIASRNGMGVNNIPSADTDYVINTNNYYQVDKPLWATHLMVEISLTNASNSSEDGKMFLKRVLFNQW